MRQFCIAMMFLLYAYAFANQGTFLYIHEQDIKKWVESMPTYIIKNDEDIKLNLSNFRLLKVERENSCLVLYIKTSLHTEIWQKIPVKIKLPPEKRWQVWKIRVENQLTKVFSDTRDFTIKAKFAPEGSGGYQCNLELVDVSGFGWIPDIFKLRDRIKKLLLEGIQSLFPKNIRQFVLANPFPDVSFILDSSSRFSDTSYIGIKPDAILKILRQMLEQGKISWNQEISGISYRDGCFEIHKTLVCPDGQKIEFYGGKLSFPTLLIEKDRVFIQTVLSFTSLHIMDQEVPGGYPVTITIPLHIHTSEDKLHFNLAEEDNDVRFLYSSDRIISRLANAINLGYKEELRGFISRFSIPKSKLNYSIRIQSQTSLLNFINFKIYKDFLILFYRF